MAILSKVIIHRKYVIDMFFLKQLAERIYYD